MAEFELDLTRPQLAAYHGLLLNARAMLEAARNGRIEDLMTLEAERQRWLSKVIEADLQVRVAADEAIRQELIQATLNYDRQTTVLVENWRDEIAEIMGSAGNERKLAHAYGGA